MLTGAFIKHALAHRLPSQCGVCRAWPSRALCEDCVQRFAQPRQRCRTCALPLAADQPQCGACIAHPPPLDACVAALDYAYPWPALITQFKFGQAPGWAHTLALLLRSAPWVEPALEQARWLLPMPLSTERLRERGYNQAALLARALAPHKTRTDLLLRVQHAPPQSTLSRAERLRAVQNAFAVEPRLAAELPGQRVVLVDDVMTSGATLHAAAQELRAAGVAHISAVVLARTEVEWAD